MDEDTGMQVKARRAYLGSEGQLERLPFPICWQVGTVPAL